MFDTHTQKYLVINNRELKYKGIFRINDLFAAINTALQERGYEKREKKSEEISTPGGRRTYIELRPFKIKSDYSQVMLKLKMTFDNMTDAVEEIQGVKRKFQKGNVRILFDAWVQTDMEHQWDQKPWVFFLRGLVHKYLYRLPHIDEPIGEVASDTAYMYAVLKNHLDTYKYEAGNVPSEEEVRKSVAEDIAKEVAEAEKDATT